MLHPDDRASPLCDVQMISSHGDEDGGLLPQSETGGKIDPELDLVTPASASAREDATSPEDLYSKIVNAFDDSLSRMDLKTGP